MMKESQMEGRNNFIIMLLGLEAISALVGFLRPWSYISAAM